MLDQDCRPTQLALVSNDPEEATGAWWYRIGEPVDGREPQEQEFGPFRTEAEAQAEME